MTQYGGNEQRTTPRVDPAPSGTALGAQTTARMSGTEQVVRPVGGHAVGHAKTSAAAVFALVFGLSALFCALTAILAPAAVVFSILGIVLGIAGLKMTKRPGVTGRRVALGGLITAVLGLLLGAAVIAGAAVLVNDERRLDQLQNQVDKLRQNLPSASQVTG